MMPNMMPSRVSKFVSPLVRKSNVAMFSTQVPSGYDNVQHYWMPFTNNRSFKKSPKMMEQSDGMYYTSNDGKKILDGCSGLWCVNAGHCQPKIVKAIQDQAAKMDYSTAFNMSNSLAYKFAEKLLELVPGMGFDQIFYTICGSSAVDTALKMSLAYHRARGESSRVRFIGKEKGYHGVGFGGMSVGGLTANRKAFGHLMPYVSHLPHTHSLKDMAFSKGLPTWGAHLAENLEQMIQFHDPSTVAAVIMEPVQGSAGVICPPQGYLERIREICSKYGVLLIFDEVITGFGRLGAPFGANKFNISPDLLTCAKGLTNGAVPCGAVFAQKHVYDALMDGAAREGAGIEFYHGYTYSGHPLAMAAGLATLEVYKEQSLFERANELAPYFEQAMHSLKSLPNVVDIRNFGLMGAVEFSVPANHPTRGIDVYERCLSKGLLIRTVGSTVACAPPFIVSKEQIDMAVSILSESIIENSKAMP